VEHGVKKIKKNELFRAIQSNNANIVKCLVDHGANVNKLNHNGETPLSMATYYGNEDIINYLVEHGAVMPNEKKEKDVKYYFKKIFN